MMTQIPQLVAGDPGYLDVKGEYHSGALPSVLVMQRSDRGFTPVGKMVSRATYRMSNTPDARDLEILVRDGVPAWVVPGSAGTALATFDAVTSGAHHARQQHYFRQLDRADRQEEARRMAAEAAVLTLAAEERRYSGPEYAAARLAHFRAAELDRKYGRPIEG